MRHAVDVTTHAQEEGDILWVPSGWGHQTCTLDAFSVGLGAISFERADLPQSDPTQPCFSEEHFPSREYRLDEVPYCQEHACPSLPTRAMA